MLDGSQAIIPLAFCQKRLASFTRRRWAQFAANHDTDYEESSAAKFACVTQCFNRIHLRMDHAILTAASAQTTGYAILPNGQEFPPLANECHMILRGVFFGISIDVGLDRVGKEMEKPGRQRLICWWGATPGFCSYLRCCS